MEPLAFQRHSLRADLMEIQTMQAGDAIRLIHRLEQNLEMSIGAVIVMCPDGQLGFVVPAEADEGYARWLLGWVADAAYNGAKSR